jgi:RNA-directed DNA polymerase
MQESHVEGLATHSGPESCKVARKGSLEALTGVRAGRVLSRESGGSLRDADAVEISARQHRARRYREMRQGPARSQTPCTYGNTSHENRETLDPPIADGAAGRVGKSKDVRRR